MYCVTFVFTIGKQVDQQSLGRGIWDKISHHTGLLTPINYNAELVLCNFWYLLMNGKRFQTVHEIKKNVVRELILILKDNFADCFEK